MANWLVPMEPNLIINIFWLKEQALTRVWLIENYARDKQKH